MKKHIEHWLFWNRCMMWAYELKTNANTHDYQNAVKHWLKVAQYCSKRLATVQDEMLKSLLEQKCADQLGKDNGELKELYSKYISAYYQVNKQEVELTVNFWTEEV